MTKCPECGSVNTWKSGQKSGEEAPMNGFHCHDCGNDWEMEG